MNKHPSYLENSTLDQPAATDKKEQLVYQQALSFLSRREHSTKELTAKLLNKSFSEALVLSCISKLKQQGYLSDKRFVEMFCRSKVSRRYGPMKINYELEQHDINQSIISQAISSHTQDFIDNAMYLIDKKLSGKSIQSLHKNPKEKNKIIHSLKLKGYDYDLIKLSLSYLSDE